MSILCSKASVSWIFFLGKDKLLTYQTWHHVQVRSKFIRGQTTPDRWRQVVISLKQVQQIAPLRGQSMSSILVELKGAMMETSRFFQQIAWLSSNYNFILPCNAFTCDVPGSIKTAVNLAWNHLVICYTEKSSWSKNTCYIPSSTNHLKPTKLLLSTRHQYYEGVCQHPS